MPQDWKVSAKDSHNDGSLWRAVCTKCGSHIFSLVAVPDPELLVSPLEVDETPVYTRVLDCDSATLFRTMGE